MKRTALTSLFASFLLTCSLGFAQSADLIITHADVYTVEAKHPHAEAVAVRDGKILFVGSAKAAEAYRGPKTKLIDAGGKLVLPGIQDSHVHFVGGSRALNKVDLNGATSLPEIQKRIREFARQHPANTWIQGRGWMYASFPGGMPHKKFLDEVVPDRPAIMSCADGHTTWVNSKALELSHIDRNTPNPQNGIIVKDENGEPTGALQEAASELVKLPEPTREETYADLLNGLAEASRQGVVRVHSLGGDFEWLDLLDRIRNEGKLTVRFSVAMFVDPPGLNDKSWKELNDARAKYHDDWIEEGGVKTMLDGVIDSLTGAMIDPYTKQGDNRGKLFWTPEDHRKTVAALDAKNIQVATHAIGDLAIRTALDSYQYAAAQNGSHDMRHKVEHIEDIAEADIPRFAKEGVIASFQPLHANPEPNWMGAWIDNVGPQREQRAFAWNALRKTGAHLAFGSDWPVVTINPWLGMQMAVTRKDFDGKPPEGWIPAQRIPLADTVYAYTMGGAYALHREKIEGSIEIGKLADLIMVSQNIFQIDPHEIAKTRVLLTVVGGKIVYESK